jgi:hypothetical protein|tara:strand:- start:19114 stop:19665 length:552 start_codon:yes stop_codon:yes gene_type:complete
VEVVILQILTFVPLTDFRIQIGKKSLARHKQRSKLESLKKMNDVREVGVVYDVKRTSAQLLNKVTHYFESEGKTVITLGYLEEQELGGYVPDKKEMYFCIKDLNFWKLPKKQAVTSFVSIDFDYLINLDMEGCNELQAISTYSASKTRMGKHFENYPFAQDFMIKSLAETAEELFNDIKQYIN